jgi:hypothetical protein
MLRDGPTDASAAVLLQWFTQGDALRKADRFLSLLQCFDIKGVFTKAESAQLASLIAHLQSEAAATAVAQAANQAQAAQQPIEQAVLNARVLQLKAHAFFQRPVR